MPEDSLSDPKLKENLKTAFGWYDLTDNDIKEKVEAFCESLSDAIIIEIKAQIEAHTEAEGH